MSSNKQKNIKVVCVGNGGCGKTTMIKKLRTGQFETKYFPTMGVEVHPIPEQDVILNIWDCAGQERFGGLQEGYYLNGSVFLICFTIYSKLELKSIDFWVKKIRQVSDDAKIILVGTKLENIAPIGVGAYLDRYKLPYVYVSAKSGYNLDRMVNIIN